MALAEDADSCVEQLSGMKIGKNTINITAFHHEKQDSLPHENIEMYFPKEYVEEEPTQECETGYQISWLCEIFVVSVAFCMVVMIIAGVL